jgi:hypothetical protein
MPFRLKKFLPGLGKKERVFMVVRQHWVVPGMKIAFWLLLLAAIFIIDGLLKANFPTLALGLTAQILEIIRVLFLMLAALGLLVVWTMYYLNAQVITNERIIDVNQKSLLHHETSEFHFDRFQDVTTEIKGLFANLFDYGNVLVQTAGEEDNFIFNHVAEPHRIAKIILEVYEKSHRKQREDGL